MWNFWLTYLVWIFKGFLSLRLVRFLSLSFCIPFFIFFCILFCESFTFAGALDAQSFVVKLLQNGTRQRVTNYLLEGDTRSFYTFWQGLGNGLAPVEGPFTPLIYKSNSQYH